MKKIYFRNKSSYAIICITFQFLKIIYSFLQFHSVLLTEIILPAVRNTDHINIQDYL